MDSTRLAPFSRAWALPVLAWAAGKELSHKHLHLPKNRKERERNQEKKKKARVCNGNTKQLQLEHLFNVISVPPATSKSASCELCTEHHKWD